MNEPTLADQWIRRINALADPKLKVRYATRSLTTCAPHDAATALEDIGLRVDRRITGGRETLMAFVPGIIDRDNILFIDKIRNAALEHELPTAERLLRSSTEQGHESPNPYQSQLDGVMEQNGRTLTLGERRALARRPSRKTIASLLRDPHPMVAHILLHNPRVTELDVLNMAARRPAIPSILHEIAQSWYRSARVRMGLVLNPGTPPAIAVPLLGLLTRPQLAEVNVAMDIPIVVRDTARQIHELRPPLMAMMETEALDDGEEREDQVP